MPVQPRVVTKKPKGQKKRVKKRNAKKNKKKLGINVVKTAERPGEPKKSVMFDARFAPDKITASTDNTTDSQNREVVQVVPLNSNVLAYISAAYVTYAVQRGYLGFATSEIFPFLAFAYLTNALIAAANGGVPAVSMMPYWVLCLMRGLAPKAVPFKLGTIAYRWDFTLVGTTYTPADSLIADGIYNTFWSIFGSGGSFIGGFPVGTPDTFPYDPVAAVNAWSEITEYMADQKNGRYESKMVPLSTKTPFDKDVSLYAFGSQFFGFGALGFGGPGVMINSEVPLRYPVLGGLATQNGNNQLVNRYPMFVNSGGSDAAWIGAIMSNLLPAPMWSFKKHTVFKFIDFNRIVDVAAKWLTAALQAYADSPTEQTVIQATGQDNTTLIPFFQCPITFQEFQLLLRNVCMCAFADTQPGVQFLVPRQPTGPMDNQFTPFISGSTTCYQGGGGQMSLPSGLVENIKALTFRFVMDRTKINGDPQLFVPVLGAYFNDALDASNYQVVIQIEGGITTTIPVFFTQTAIRQRKVLKSSKGPDVVTFTAVPEPVISMFDGKSGINYLFINDVDRLTAIMNLWNGFVQENVASYSMPLVYFTKDAGLNILSCVTLTDYWYPQNVDRKANSLEFEDTRMTSRKSLPQPTYQNKTIASVSSQGPFYSSAWDNILSVWIHPEISAIVDAPSPEMDNSFTKLSVYSGEPFSQTMSTGADGEPMDQLHYQYALHMIKGITAPQNEWEMILAEAEKSGRGGILSGLINTVLKSTGIIPPSVSAITDTIASVLPF